MVELRRRILAIHPACVGLLGFALYARTIAFGFLTYDEPWLVENNYLLKHPSFGGLRTLLFDLSSDQRFRLGAEYLPVRDLSVMLDHALFGMWPGGHHLSNVVLYGVLCAMVGWFVDAWLRQREVAWLTGLLFAVHPIHVEAVAWLAERKGILAGIFLLGALLASRRAVIGRRASWWLIATVLLLCAIWSKALAVTGVALLPALLVLFPPAGADPRSRSIWMPCAGWITVGALAFLPALYAGKQMHMVQPPHAHGLLGNLELFAQIHWKYVSLLFLGGDFNISYPVVTTPWFLMVLGALLVILFLVPLVQALRGGDRTLAFASWWWFVGLAPVSQLVFPIQNLMADRYMLIPSVAWCLAAASLLNKLGPAPRTWIAGVFIAAAATMSLLQTNVWSSSLALYERAVTIDPSDASGWNQLASLAADHEDMARAWALTEAGLQHAPTDWHLVHRKALLYERMGRHAEAIAWMRKAAALPGADTAMANLALLLLDRGASAEARQWALRAVEANPRSSHHLRSLGVVLLSMGRVDAAEDAFERALTAGPEEGENHFNLGLARLTRGDRAGAEQAFEEAVRLDPRMKTEVATVRAQAAKRAKPGGKP